MLRSHAMEMEGHLFYHKKILVKQVLEKVYVPIVLVMTISFLLHKYWLNHRLTRCLSKFIE